MQTYRHSTVGFVRHTTESDAVAIADAAVELTQQLNSMLAPIGVRTHIAYVNERDSVYNPHKELGFWRVTVTYTKEGAERCRQ